MKIAILLLASLLVICTTTWAQIPLQQSTASQSVKFGPFVDATDGNTQETGLTIANTDIRCSKNGGTLAAKNSGGGTHDANGWYTVTFDATDTNTAGRLQCYVHVAGALPVHREFMVYPTANYAALFSTAPGAANGLQIAGSNAATTYASLTVTGTTTMSDGLVVARSSSNQPAATFTGNGTGNGVTITSGSGATGTGLAVSSAATNGSAVTLAGTGTGNGMTATGGTTGHGISGVGGATSGNGIRAAGTAGNSAAMNLVGQGSAAGLLSTGGATGAGASLVGGATSGVGLAATGSAGNSAGASFTGQGSSNGLTATGGATGHGISAVGGATSGSGLRAVATTSGNGILATGVGTTQAGIAATGGSTSSAGISATGGGTGSGILATSGGGATGNGITATATSTNGHGMALTGNGSGTGLSAAITGSLSGSVGSVASGGITNASFACTGGSFLILGVTDCGTAQSASGTGLVLRSAAAFADDTAIGQSLLVEGSTQGYAQSRTVTDNALSGDAFTVDTWTVTPSGTISYYLFGTSPSSGGGGGLDAAGVRAAVGLASANLDTQLSGIQSDTDNLQTRVPASLVSGRMDASVGAYQSGLTPLQPTVAGRTLDVTTGGEAGIDWANIGSPTTSVNFSGTTISTSQAVASVSGAVGSVTGNVGGLTATAQGHVQTAAAAALTAYDPPTNTEMEARTIASANYATASNLATVDTVVDGIKAVTDNLPDSGALTSLATGAALATVDTVADAIKLTTDKLDDTLEDDAGTYRFTANALEQAPTGSGESLSAIADAVWDEALSGHATAGSAGAALSAASSAGDPWATALPGAYGSGTAGNIIGNRLDAAVSTRASQSSVDALNDLDATEAQAAAAAALAAYDPPTRAEATNDTNSVLTAVGDVPTNAELATALAGADDATLAAIAALNNLSAAQIRDAISEDQGSVTRGCIEAVLLAFAAGDISTTGSTTTWRDPSNSEVRITSTVTSAGNRTASITCPTY